MIATHYYSGDCIPLLNILSATDEEQAHLIVRLARNPNKAFNRFRNIDWYLNERRKLESWMHEAFIGLGGKPKICHPLYFVLGYSTYLKGYYGKEARHITIDIDTLNPQEISFTLYDSLAMFVTDEYDKKLYTKDMIVEYLQHAKIDPEKLDGQKRYIEMQVWNNELRGNKC